MNFLIPAAWAQAQGGGVASPTQLPTLVLMLAFVGVFYLLLIRPQQKKLKEHQSLISKLSAGDEVVTNGGMLGRITDVGDTFITMEVADGVRVKVQKVQIASLMPKGTLKNA